MAALSRLPQVLGSDGFPQSLQPTDVLQISSYTVATLPTGSGVKNGSVAYATNGRAQTGTVTLGVATLQNAGAGTGVLVTYNAAASVWQIVGTATTVQS